MAPNNFEFDFEQIFLIHSNPQKENHRNPDLDYFDEINVPSNET